MCTLFIIQNRNAVETRESAEFSHTLTSASVLPSKNDTPLAETEQTICKRTESSEQVVKGVEEIKRTRQWLKRKREEQRKRKLKNKKINQNKKQTNSCSSLHPCVNLCMIISKWLIFHTLHADDVVGIFRGTNRDRKCVWHNGVWQSWSQTSLPSSSSEEWQPQSAETQEKGRNTMSFSPTGHYSDASQTKLVLTSYWRCLSKTWPQLHKH